MYRAEKASNESNMNNLIFDAGKLNKRSLKKGYQKFSTSK